jgi:gliding motility-associated-like protein
MRTSKTTQFFEKLFLSFLFIVFSTRVLHSQVMDVSDAATPPYTPVSLISDVFLGDGVDVLSVQFNGEPVAIGAFFNGMKAVGLDRGIVLTTGSVSSNTSNGNNIIGCDLDGTDFASTANGSTATSALLAALTTGPLNDVAVITIRFRPTADTLRFRYCFASEEYPEYGCSRYNDVFGFFISGPGYPNPTNIAIIPNTNLPVTINNLHPANSAIAGCVPFNEHLFIDNLGMNMQPTYDGRTKVLEAVAIVRPCQEYIIRLAIADVNDARWDSGVFLEARSFSSSGSVKAEIVTPPASATMAEGCDPLTLRITLPEIPKTETPVRLTIRGTAVNGTDYCTMINGNKVPLPDLIRFPPGRDTLEFPLISKLDNITESKETILIDYQRNACRRDTCEAFIIDNIMKDPLLRPDTLVCSGNFQPLRLNGTVPVQVPRPPSFTNQSDVNMPIPFLTYSSSINVSGIVPAVLGPDMLASVCVNIDHNWDDDLDIFLVAPNGRQIVLSTDNGNQGDDYTNTCFTINAPLSITAGSAPFTGNYRPETPLSDLYGTNVNGTWTLRVIDDALGQSGTLRDWTINFVPTYKIDYSWTPTVGLSCTDCPIPTATPTVSSNYIVKAKDTYGCIGTDTFEVDVEKSLDAPVVECDKPAQNEVIFRWSGIAQQGYEINTGTGWRAAPADSVLHFGNLTPSTPVTLQVRGIGGVTQCLPLVASKTCATCADIATQATIRPVSCVGRADGTVLVVPDGKLPPYSFQLDGVTNNTGAFSGLKAGSYVYTVTDGIGCKKTFTISIPTPDTLKASLSRRDVSCFGGSNGTLTATPSGGTGAKTYSWSFVSQPGPIASNLAIGTYTVTVRDENGCTATATAELKQPDEIKTILVPESAKCFDQPSGKISTTITGGVSPYRFQWNNNVATKDLNGVRGGTYTLIVTDANNCSKTQTTSVGQATAIQIPVTANAVQCFNSDNGTATAAPSGGTPPYKFAWSSGGTTATINNLLPTTYIVTVTDANGCTETSLAAITAPPAIVADASAVQVSCFNGANGSATVTASGGTGSLSYVWSDPARQTTSVASNLTAGTYSVTVRDGSQCTQTAEVSIRQPSAININAVSKDVQCGGDQNGSIELSVKGGTQGYTYSWSNSATTQNLTALSLGIYTVTIRDANGCTVTLTDTIAEPPALVLTGTVDSAGCYGEATGKIRVAVSGGTPRSGPPYVLAWSGNGINSTAADLANLQAGDYTLVVTDGKGCRKTQVFSVMQPAQLALSLPLVSDTVCFAAKNGIIRTNALGGTPPYRYTWSNAQTTVNATDLRVGEYEVTITDRNNCTTTALSQVLQKAEVFALTTFENPSCRNGRNGTATASSVFYGADPANPAAFRYQWNTTPVQTTRTATGLPANGFFTVTVTDADGCSATREARLGNPDTLFATIPEVKKALCFGSATGSARVAGNGGTAPYSYFWSVSSPTQKDSLITGLQAGTYRVTVTDARNCPAVQEVKIGQPDAISGNFSVDRVRCFGGKDGAATLRTIGGVSPYTYLWQDGSTAQRITAQPAGRIAVTITDANKCTVLEVVEVGQPEKPLEGTAEKQDATCFGASNGKVTIRGTGGTPPYRYSLNNGDLNGSSLQFGLSAGTYRPQIVDANGCTTDLSAVTIDQRPPVLVNLGPDLVIQMGKDTSLAATVSQAREPVTMEWKKEDSQWLSCLDCEAPEVVQLYFTRDFLLRVTDSLGCIGEDVVRVEVQKTRLVFVPEGFTPNDDGNNDLLLVHGQKDVKILKFRIYDRWGELMYEAADFAPNNTSIGWDGMFRESPMNPATFVWTLDVEYLDGFQETLKGHTQLIR